MSDIHKSAAIIIQDRKLLVSRTRGKEAFVSPGGKLETGETPESALKRELMEEQGITAQESDMEFFGSYIADAVYDPGHQLQMDVYMLKKWEGELTPAHEIEEIKWITSSDLGRIKLGSIFEHEAIPKLKEQNLID